MADIFTDIVAVRTDEMPRTGIVSGNHAGPGIMSVIVNGSQLDAVNEMAGWWHQDGDIVIVEPSPVGPIRVVRSLAYRPTFGTLLSLNMANANDIRDVTVQATHPTLGDCTFTALPGSGYLSAGSAVSIEWTIDGAVANGTRGWTRKLPPDIAWNVQPDNPAQATTALPDVLTPPDDPTTVTLQAVDSGTWDGSWSADDTLIQGSMTGTEATLACWLYDAHIDAVSSWPAASAEITIIRGGESEIPATIHLVGHTASTRSDTPSPVGDPVDAGVWLPGETRTIPLPATITQQLLTGAAQGVGVTATGAADMTSLAGVGTDVTSGQITMTRR